MLGVVWWRLPCTATSFAKQARDGQAGQVRSSEIIGNFVSIVIGEK